MASSNHPLQALIPFLPENTFDDVVYFLETYSIHLSIKKDRKGILGDYRPSYDGKPHRISVNAGLNKYHFIITLIHEIAHLITFLNHKNKVKPHGNEWKQTFSHLLKRFTDKKIFPLPIEKSLLKYIKNPKASTCTDEQLYLTLMHYNEGGKTKVVADLQIGDTFKDRQGIAYTLIEKRRTRYACRRIISGELYLFPSIYEIGS
jgi:hypothetical protein